MADCVEVTRVKNAVLYSDGTILLENVRASYPHLDKPYKGQDGDKEAYGIVLLLPKSTHVEAKDLLKAEIDRLLKENKTADVASDKKFLRNGDGRGKEEMKGTWTVSARETRPPAVRDNRKRKLSEAEIARMFYGGCWVNAIIRPWFQKNKYGTRVNSGLTAVQFCRDDEPFGEGRITDEDVDNRFGVVGGDDDDNDAGFGDGGDTDDL